MKRPNPPKAFIGKLLHDPELRTAVYRGLYEVPLSGAYAHLNLNEAVAFAASMRNAREDDDFFGYTVQGLDLYELFELHANRRVITGPQYRGPTNNVWRWLNGQKKVSAQDPLYKQLNPFGRKDSLGERLDRVDPEVAARIISDLTKPVIEFTSKHDYHDRKAVQQDMHDVVIAPTNVVIEVARMIRGYGREYVPLNRRKREDAQMALFSETSD